MGKNSFQDGAGPTQRQLRVGELIRRTLAQVLAQGEIHDTDLNRLYITVGEVRCSNDLKIATAYVMPLGGVGRDDAVAFLARNKHELRRLIGTTVGLQYTPDLRFRLDETFDQMDATREMFSRDEVKRDLDD